MELKKRQLQITIFLISFCILILQMTYMRILSVVLWYHMAFLSISLSLLGLGVPGVWFSIKKPSYDLLKKFLFLASVLTPLSVVLIFKLGQPNTTLTTMISIVAILPTLIILGSVVCIVLTLSPTKWIASLYGSDLLGAALGAIVVFSLLKIIPAPHLIVLVGLIPLGNYWFLSSDKKQPRIFLVLSFIFTILFFRWPLELNFTKDYSEAKINGKKIFEQWSPLARITIFDHIFWSEKDVEFTWGSARNKKYKQVEQYWLEQDGGAGTPIIKFDGNLSTLDYLLGDVTSMGYQVREPESAVIIGAGGGRDILTAIRSHVKNIHAVELNEVTVNAVDEKFGKFSGKIYSQVHSHISEGRNFLSQTKEKFDLIQISMIDSWAATVAGAFALSENNLYTVEAFRLYWQRLSESGLVSTSRWLGLEGQYYETSRLAGIVLEALKQEGVTDPQQHIAVIRGGAVATILMTKSAMDQKILQKISSLCDEHSFDLFYPLIGNAALESPISDLIYLGENIIREYTEADLKPSTDDRPFFFQVWPVFKFSSMDRSIFTLQATMLIVSFLALILFLLPMRYVKLERKQMFLSSFYFASIGIAFMMVEMFFMQSFVLYLGHPSYASSVVLFSLLLGTGCGAIYSEKRSYLWMIVTPLFFLWLYFNLHHLFEKTLDGSLGIRIAISVVVLFLSGFLMGCWFPKGMKSFSEQNKSWFWAVNGITSVVATIFSLGFAIEFGLSAVLLLGVMFYLLALLWMVLAERLRWSF